MEDFPVLLLILLFYLFSGALSGKKNKKNKGKKSPAGRPGASPRRSARGGGRLQEFGLPSWMDAKQPQQSAAAREADCETRPIHLHEVSQEDFICASEGEDPCHAGGMRTDEESSVYVQEHAGEEQLAGDLLRGVIMSEILTRPADRMTLRRSGRSGK